MPETITSAYPSPVYRSRDQGEPVKPICVGLEPADLARLDQLSLDQRINRSALIRRAIKRLLASYKPGPTYKPGQGKAKNLGPKRIAVSGNTVSGKAGC